MVGTEQLLYGTILCEFQPQDLHILYSFNKLQNIRIYGLKNNYTLFWNNISICYIHLNNSLLILSQRIHQRQIMVADDWRECVIAAIEAGDSARLDELLQHEHKEHLNFICPSAYGYNTPLMKAIKRDNVHTADKLINAGASVHFPDLEGLTPLIRAAVSTPDICRLLLAHGAGIHVQHRDHWQQSPLYMAVNYGRRETVSLLLEKGAEIYYPSMQWDDPNTSPVAAAINFSLPDKLEVLLNHCRKTSLRTPLAFLFKWAIKIRREECAAIILQQGYYPILNVVKPDTSYFEEAARRGQVRVVSLMVELNPHFMQENWLVTNCIPDELERKHANFVSWLVEYRKQPPALLKLCKSSILAQLDTPYTPKIKELPLPKILKVLLTTVETVYEEF